MTISCHRGREMECVKHRSQVIKCILEAKEDLCPAVTVKESLIHSSCSASTVCSSPKFFFLSELVRTLLENDSELVSDSGEVSVEIEQLLYFEPYACFSLEILRELVDKSENSSDQPVSKAFPYGMKKACRTMVNQLKQALGIDSTQFQAALARVPPFQRDHPEYQCKLVFQVWKENTQSPTYRALRSALDNYSVFCGRNPLELAGELSKPPPPPPPPRSADKQPTLIELVRFRGRERRINVPQEISTKYFQFGILLLEDANGARVSNIEHKHRGDVEQINMEILQEWVSGRGRQPVSWATLTEVLRDVELCELASDIEAVKLQTADDSDT